MNAATLRFWTRQVVSSRDPLHHTTRRTPRACIVAKWLYSRGLSTSAPFLQEASSAVPLRKHLKDEAKRKKQEARIGKDGAGAGGSSKAGVQGALEKWELTVGVEIHAELNTAAKLFSSAATEPEGDALDVPNDRVAYFDAALPGAQPQFQVATLLPAIRAALALNCTVQRKSSWDRKHYFHWDQPSGYQITQYYGKFGFVESVRRISANLTLVEPFAKDGVLELTAEDGVPETDLNGAEKLSIGIKQVQMEQDTAKTTNYAPGSYHIDLNRAGHPLVEIITWPEIHSPQTAAAVVRKIASILKSVDACVAGMEVGGLRADVNVSIRQRPDFHSDSSSSANSVTSPPNLGAPYGIFSGLGQRTEIKNLSSFKAVEDAIIAERNRQIALLEAGGVIEGETRGWTLGSTETTRLRGKEGEVDYRYMPDADLPPLLIGQDLIDHLGATLPELPDATAARLTSTYAISVKDARTLVALDDGDRLDFMEATIAHLQQACEQISVTTNSSSATISKLAANWVLHEIGGLLTSTSTTWSSVALTPTELADILAALHRKAITARSAKHILATLFHWQQSPHAAPRSRPSVADIITNENLQLRPLSREQYERLARDLMDANPDKVKAIREKGQRGKIMWFVGQMVRAADEGTVEPDVAREVVEGLIG